LAEGKRDEDTGIRVDARGAARIARTVAIDGGRPAAGRGDGMRGLEGRFCACSAASSSM
jgi:hypothetical protein